MPGVVKLFFPPLGKPLTLKLRFWKRIADEFQIKNVFAFSLSFFLVNIKSNSPTFAKRLEHREHFNGISPSGRI